MSRQLGVVTIGQTPRRDLEEAFRRHAGDVDVAVEGALDESSPSHIEALAAHPGTYPLLVRLADGTSVQIDRDALMPLVSRKAAHLARRGAGVVVIACAGDVPRFDCGGLLLLPGALLPGIMRAVSPTRRLGIVTPVAGQVLAARAKWTGDGFDPRVTHASPDDADAMAGAAALLNDAPCDVVLLDCMGHDDGYRQAFADRCRHPVLLAQTIVARIAGELIMAVR